MGGGVVRAASIAQPRAAIHAASIAQPRALVTGKSQAFPARRAFLPTSMPGVAQPGGVVRAASIAQPRGVDLNLDNFDLSEATKVSMQAPRISLGEDTFDAIGNDFWPNVDCCKGSVFNEEDRVLLASLFNRRLC